MFPAIRTVLHATDLSKNSAYVFRYAITTAKKHDAKIHIINVFETSPSVEAALTPHMYSENTQYLKKERVEEVINLIRERCQEFAKRELVDQPDTLDRVASIIVVSGDPTQMILQQADKLNADVIIMGKHSKGIIGHAFMGSVAEKVLHRSRRPVYIIPLPSGEQDITLGEI
jgi:nucleotide-binding universal stress UspA family protein